VEYFIQKSHVLPVMLMLKIAELSVCVASAGTQKVQRSWLMLIVIRHYDWNKNTWKLRGCHRNRFDGWKVVKDSEMERK
jgi:hypothetical protein